MYLKSIEVYGFKSFANKILFEFHNGITGIVGPNGSGKSNVADAVRWVLGEQSVKQLRGSSMQDVIFSGTQNRKPLSYAYVAITLDNSDHSLSIDYDEVTVARRLYRSGESEYLINGNVCRLKDVNELFYDTGIGKEGYSIIGQGQIDKILSGKPEERRELFDEAAGIVKFKRRKNETIKKLESEKQNLLRITDILSELERQVGPLEKQSQKAKVYLKKKEEMKNLDINIFFLENKALTENLEQVTTQLENSVSKMEEDKQQFETIKTEYDEVQRQIEELELKINEEREKLSSTSETKTRLQGQIGIFKEQIKAAKDNEKHFKDREQVISLQLNDKEKEKQAIINEKNQYDEGVKEQSEELKTARGELTLIVKEMDDLNDQTEKAKQSIMDALSVRATIKGAASSLDTKLEQLRVRKSELSSKLLSVKSEEQQQDEIILELENKFEEINEVIRNLNEKQKELDEKNSSYSGLLSETDKKIRDAQVLYHELKAKYESISNITQRYEGYDKSVKRVMEEKENEKGIIGVAADVITVDHEYEVAIETALGGNIKNIITRDEETAKKMIRFLKENRFGRATFLPLESIKKPQEFKTPEVLDENGVIGLACDLVTTKPEYKNVAKAMLGRIVVVKNQDLALKIARKYDYGIRMVTLEGELLVPGGAISGGAFKSTSNLLSRRREMEELKEKQEKQVEIIDQLEAKILEIRKERQDTRKEIEETRLLLQNKFIEQNTARLNVISAKEKKDESGKGFEQLKEEIEGLEREIEEILLMKVDNQNKLNESEKLEAEMQVKIAQLQKSLDELHDKEVKTNEIVNRKHTENEIALQKQLFMQSNIDRINQESGVIRAELDEVLEKIEESEKEISLKEQQISQIEETIGQSSAIVGESKQVLEDSLLLKQKLTDNQKHFFEKREELSDRINALDKENYRLSTRKNSLSQQVETKINYMWTEYEITLSEAAKMADEERTDLPGMKKDIDSLKDEIRKLGDVNVNAIEEYKEVMERYTFLSGQHKDLVESGKMLEEVIANLDTSMRTQFAEKFAQINEEFDKVFKELFGGGKGTLELLEEEDILEAGIKIIAQPPGKKLQNMMQLSGGEKALTAIALLFAIQNLKPSPFCLLDEIEAALDDSNVGRFAKYLHKLTKHTQFIVITHRRGTMERADRLYGITMQEKGVSALVSVNLIENDLSS